MNTTLKCKLCTEHDQSQFRSKIIRGKLYYEKICRKCEAKKALEYYHSHHKERAEYQKEYIKKNKKLIKNKKKQYDKMRYNLLKDEILSKCKQYAKHNRKIINSNLLLRRKNNPAYRLRCYMSSMIRDALKQNNSKKLGSCIKFLDYSFKTLQNHIEKQFEPWMTWDNHGKYDPNIWDDNDKTTWKWQIDHIVPQSDLPYISMEDNNFKKCWALDNLRPLNAKSNIIDGTNRLRHAK